MQPEAFFPAGQAVSKGRDGILPTSEPVPSRIYQQPTLTEPLLRSETSAYALCGTGPLPVRGLQTLPPELRLHDGQTARPGVNQGAAAAGLPAGVASCGPPGRETPE